MKTHKIYKIMLMALMLFTASLFITGVDAEAKAYKAKNVKVTSGKTKTVKTKKKIKKVKIVSKNKNFTVKKTGNYKFKVSGTDKGKSQTVKVTYTNKYTQKFKIKTVKAKKKTTKKIPSYAQKIVNELKPLLANPDKCLQTVLNDWTKRLNPRDGYTYEFSLGNFRYQLGQTISTLTVDDILKNYTASQKKALILEVYFRQRMSYSHADNYWANRNSNAYFKKLYNGTFKGVCEDGAVMAYDICKYLGIKAYYTGSHEMNHAWCGIYATDKNGVSYYHGIYTTAYPYSMKASVPAKYNRGTNSGANMSEAQVKKYLCSPNAATFFTPLQRRIKNPPTRKPAPTTAPSVTTQAPVQTPAPTPKPSPTTTTVIFNTPEPPEPDDTPTLATTTEPTKAPVVTQGPEKTPEPTKTPTPTTPAPIVTPEPTPEPTVEPTVEPTPIEQRIMIPHAEHNYTCPGCNVPYRHKDAKNPYITNGSATSGNITVYKHSTSEGIRYFDADGNEYIDINKNGNIMDELALLQG